MKNKLVLVRTYVAVYNFANGAVIAYEVIFCIIRESLQGMCCYLIRNAGWNGAKEGGHRETNDDCC